MTVQVQAQADGQSIQEEHLPAKPLLVRCDKNHLREPSRTFAGKCGGCTRPIDTGELVTHCRQCRSTLCTFCHPVIKCRAGHTLRTMLALSGRCDGCGRQLSDTDLVSDCRECDWYLCNSCSPVMQCREGHELLIYRTRVPGFCNGCGCLVKEHTAVMDCRHCDWYLCENCRIQDGFIGHATPIDWILETLPRCPLGHHLQPRLAREGFCDRCQREVTRFEMVMDCFGCNWYLCGACLPIKQCPQGHPLKMSPAVEGACDGCQQKVLANQSVMVCEPCNWYLCSTCHLPRVTQTCKPSANDGWLFQLVPVN